MPELPEVEITVRDLKKKVLSRTIFDVWTDFEKMIKKPDDFEQFRKEIRGRKIEEIWRRGKNILFDLSRGKTLLVHQKLTGHLLFGRWKKENEKWIPPPGPLSEKINTYIHFVLTLDSGDMVALSDLRKFAKIELWNRRDLKKELNSLGLEPLERSFTFEKFKKSLERRRSPIKKILMNQEVIAGIGNIYSDEILWEAKINPFRKVNELSDRELRRTFRAIKKILKKGIKLKGESISDFRRVSGEKGGFDEFRKVYRREGESCPLCGTKIKKEKISGRSTHFCPKCQK